MKRERIVVCANCGKKYRVRVPGGARAAGHDSTITPFNCRGCNQPVDGQTPPGTVPPNYGDEALQDEFETSEARSKLEQYRTMAIVFAPFSGLLFLMFRSEQTPLGGALVWILALTAVGFTLAAAQMRSRPVRSMALLGTAATLFLAPLGYIAWRLVVLSGEESGEIGRKLLLYGTLLGVGAAWVVTMIWHALPWAREAERQLREREEQSPSG